MQRARESDIDDCVALWLEAVRAREGREPAEGTAERARAKFALPRVSWRVARADARLRGFALVTGPGTGVPSDPAGAGYLGLLAVDPRDEGAGIGRALLDTVTADARAAKLPALVLHVLVDNERALRLYDSAGWRVQGERRPHPLTGAPFATLIRELI
ncbi:GNAT family N-acetyltransferase [Microbacteriaceae bacterium VKM Ac-2855]|nr:GNAT family N-acetyltransferase [Microbacteriaceae bacterium VKM Ac-2855]